MRHRLAFLLILLVAPLCWAQEAVQPVGPAPGVKPKEAYHPPIEAHYPAGEGNYKAVRGMLNPNATLVIQMGIFVVFLLITTRLVFRPTLSKLDERRELIARNLREAKEFKQKAAEMKKEYQSKLADARAHAAHVVVEHEHKARDKSSKAIHQRQEELKASVLERRAQLTAEIEEQKADVEKKAPALGKALASKLLGRKI